MYRLFSPEPGAVDIDLHISLATGRLRERLEKRTHGTLKVPILQRHAIDAAVNQSPPNPWVETDAANRASHPKRSAARERRYPR